MIFRTKASGDLIGWTSVGPQSGVAPSQALHLSRVGSEPHEAVALPIHAQPIEVNTNCDLSPPSGDHREERGTKQSESEALEDGPRFSKHPTLHDCYALSLRRPL